MYYEELEEGRSSDSFPFPLLDTGVIDEGTGKVIGLPPDPGLLVLASWVPLASCQAGMVGLPRAGRGDDGVDIVGARVRRRAFRDLSSCCNSVNVAVCNSLFLSIIWPEFQLYWHPEIGAKHTLGTISRILLTSSRISRISSRVLTSLWRISATISSTSLVVFST